MIDLHWTLNFMFSWERWDDSWLSMCVTLSPLSRLLTANTNSIELFENTFNLTKSGLVFPLFFFAFSSLFLHLSWILSGNMVWQLKRQHVQHNTTQHVLLLLLLLATWHVQHNTIHHIISHQMDSILVSIFLHQEILYFVLLWDQFNSIIFNSIQFNSIIFNYIQFN